MKTRCITPEFRELSSTYCRYCDCCASVTTGLLPWLTELTAQPVSVHQTGLAPSP